MRYRRHYLLLSELRMSRHADFQTRVTCCLHISPRQERAVYRPDDLIGMKWFHQEVVPAEIQNLHPQRFIGEPQARMNMGGWHCFRSRFQISLHPPSGKVWPLITIGAALRRAASIAAAHVLLQINFHWHGPTIRPSSRRSSSRLNAATMVGRSAAPLPTFCNSHSFRFCVAIVVWPILAPVSILSLQWRVSNNPFVISRRMFGSSSGISGRPRTP